MKNQKIRDALNAYGKDYDLEITYLDNPSFDNSITGVTEDGRVIYDFDTMVVEMSTEDEIDEIEATEFIEYNTLRAIPYFPNAPIVMRSIDSLMEQYSDGEWKVCF